MSLAPSSCERELRFALACQGACIPANSLPVFAHHREKPNIGLPVHSIQRRGFFPLSFALPLPQAGLADPPLRRVLFLARYTLSSRHYPASLSTTLDYKLLTRSSPRAVHGQNGNADTAANAAEQICWTHQHPQQRRASPFARRACSPATRFWILLYPRNVE